MEKVFTPTPALILTLTLTLTLALDLALALTLTIQQVKLSNSAWKYLGNKSEIQSSANL